MKQVYIRDIVNRGSELVSKPITLMGWLKARRDHGGVVFLDIVDSTGTIQAICTQGTESYDVVCKIPLESGVILVGVVSLSDNRPVEVITEHVDVVGIATLNLSPQPRSNFDIFDEAIADHMAKNRAVYLRNPTLMNIIRCRSQLMRIARDWFYENGFMEFDAPILTPAPLYDDTTAMGIQIKTQSMFLTQCAGFYLEAAAHAFERVFNMGPSFRGEESRSKRHLKEYWHIKAEMTWGDREDIIGIVESFLSYVYEKFPIACEPWLKGISGGSTLRESDFKTPFARITYEDAIKKLQRRGLNTGFGEHISSRDEEELAKMFDGPFWITGIPRSVEPFPYVIDPDDARVTMVADLIAPRGYGELCGVAEKIHDPSMLRERMVEKDKQNDPRYKFVRDVHEAGCVPHVAFGMGLERLLRWLLDIPHVRDTIPFPRAAGRLIEH